MKHHVSIAKYNESVDNVAEWSVARFDNFEDADWLMAELSKRGEAVYHWFENESGPQYISLSVSYGDEYRKIKDD